MSKPTSDQVFDIGRDLQRAYDEGYKQGRYDEKVGKEMPLPNGEQTHALRTNTHAVRSDTISRQAAIDAAVEAADEWDGGYSRSREEIITLKLRMLPSANKSGHWVMNPSEVAGDGYYICSNCNNDVYDATDFCPNCGSYNGGENHDKG